MELFDGQEIGGRNIIVRVAKKDEDPNPVDAVPSRSRKRTKQKKELKTVEGEALPNISVEPSYITVGNTNANSFAHAAEKITNNVPNEQPPSKDKKKKIPPKRKRSKKKSITSNSNKKPMEMVESGDGDGFIRFVAEKSEDIPSELGKRKRSHLPNKERQFKDARSKMASAPWFKDDISITTLHTRPSRM